MMKALLLAVCTAAGIGVGIVTRPTLLGFQILMGVLTSGNQFDAEPKSMLISHLAMTAGIGLLCGIVLALVVSALTRQQRA